MFFSVSCRYWGYFRKITFLSSQSRRFPKWFCSFPENRILIREICDMNARQSSRLNTSEFSNV